MIPVSEPLLTEVEHENVAACLRSGWISSAGSYLDAFEAEWAAYCGRRHGVAVANGTLALQAAVAVLDLEPGSQVLMPALSIISCALAAVYNDLEPVLVDADPATWCMDVGAVEAAITPRTRAVMPVHLYGHPVDMDPLLELARRHDLRVIEDAAEAHGATYGGRRCGSFGDLSIFSFYANKLITTGEGGMVLTDRDDLAAALRGHRNLYFHGGRRFHHEQLGQNFRFTNLQAALGLGQVRRMDAILAAKRRLAATYTAGLAGLPGLLLPREPERGASCYWMYAVVLVDDCPLDAAALGLALAERGVETRPFFLGLHEQPALRARGLFADQQFPVAERLARRGLYLPSGLGLTAADQAHVLAAVRDALADDPEKSKR